MVIQVLGRDSVRSCGPVQKEHHVSDGPSHRGGRESLCVLERRRMSGRPAQIRQRDLKQMIFAAQKAGVKESRVRLSDGTEVVIPLSTTDEKSVAPEEQIRL